jgi:1,6-anhydro-N-acetylmuramate kinase
MLSALAASLGRTARVALRVNPDVDAKTHAKITTGRSENKFGVAIDDAPALYAQLAALPGLVQPEVFVCGGGARNAELMRALRAELPGSAVDATDALGVAAGWVEALAFAWLARQRVLGLPGNCPQVTGASRAAVLGGLYLPG